jgi:hypothetical protein
MLTPGQAHYLAWAEPLRIVERIDKGVNFSGQSAVGSADRLLAVFFSCAGAVLVRPHDGASNDHVFVVLFTRQQLENTLENSTLRQSTEALMHDLPIAKTLRGEKRVVDKTRIICASSCAKVRNAAAKS